MVPRKARYIGFGLPAAVFFLSCAVPVSAQTTLRYKFKEGEKLHYSLVQKMSAKQGFETAMQTIDLSVTVKEVKDGNAKLALQFERLRLTMSMSKENKIEYDSKEGKELEGGFGKFLGSSLDAMSRFACTMTVDELGQISKTDIQQKLGAGNKLAMMPGVGEMFSPDNLRKVILILPKDAVSKGTTWNQENTVKTFMLTKKVDTVYTYEGETEKDGQKLEKISLKPNISIKGDPKRPSGLKITAQKGKGTAYFDNVAGRLTELHLSQTLSVGFAGGGENVGERSEQTMTLKLKK